MLARERDITYHHIYSSQHYSLDDNRGQNCQGGNEQRTHYRFAQAQRTRERGRLMDHPV
jgi:hypothetical protein